jgi:hypothetical protein
MKKDNIGIAIVSVVVAMLLIAVLIRPGAALVVPSGESQTLLSLACELA